MNRWAFLAVAVAACSRDPAPSGKHAFLVVESPGSGEIDVARARAEGAGIVATTLSGSSLVLDLDPERIEGGLVVRADGACLVALSTHDVASGRTIRRTLTPLFDFGAPPVQIGFDTTFELEARPLCREAESMRLTWTPQGDPNALRDVAVSPDGRKFRARTERLEQALGKPIPWGVVPLSPRTRGATDILVSASGTSGAVWSRTIRLSAAARSRGLPNVALGTRIYLGGDGFRVIAAPTGGKAEIESVGERASFAPDARGKWTLADGDGRSLRLVAGKYDETPLDCGRSDCHRDIADIARQSPMATILERGLDAHFAGDYPACALGCHTVGEPGVDDGGFTTVLGELGRTAPDLARTGFHDVPPPLRRLGGVSCLGCHGPGAIPEESARFSILAAAVCETCHDAPPRYGHAVAWRRSRMARADADPRVSADAACARCHTTWGFLGRPDRKPHEGAEPLGIACAACHAVHPVGREEGRAAGTTCADALLREVPLPSLFSDGIDARAQRSRICLGCHAPSMDEVAPSASAAALWAGRGGRDPTTGDPLDGPSTHAVVNGGCIGCHRAGPAGLERGAGHAFGAAPDACLPCHAPNRRDPTLRVRAESLWKSTGGASAGAPHAGRPRLDLATPRGRAAYDVALVLEDPAADSHNAPYARRLLDAAERTLGATPASMKGGGLP